MDDTVNPDPLDHHFREPQQDEEHDLVFGPSPQPNAAMRSLLDHLRAQGFRIFSQDGTFEPGGGTWRVACPWHPVSKTGVMQIGMPVTSVELEQRANGTVWVHPPAGYLSCSCTSQQVLAGFRTKDPLVVPAGTTITDTALHQLAATAVRESYGAVTWSDTPAEPANWLDEPLVERGQFVSIYGPAGIGKSLLAQERAATLSRAGYRVLYLDAENPPSEVKARFHAMAYNAADLANLTYLSFPNLPALDSPAGAARLATIADAIDPHLIVLDTWSKFLAGDEASPSTHTAAYNLSIVPLRRRGVAVQAIDHSGKDPGRGPRGGSSKVDNVDTLWLVTSKASDRLRLERRKSRTGRGPDLVELVRRERPLRHERRDLAHADVLSPEVRECVAQLDALDVPAGWGRDRAGEVLRANGYRIGTDTLSTAVRVRRERGSATADTLDLSAEDQDSADRYKKQDQDRLPDRSGNDL